GVGFRPFVHRLAAEGGLSGFVVNDGDGVLIEIEGAGDSIARFTDALRSDAPSAARVDSVATAMVPTTGDQHFPIEASPAGARRPLSRRVPHPRPPSPAGPRAPADRRYRYPFVNCTQCGPRFTIVRTLPYDRERTTMAAFEMCDDCRREYEDPTDRRFHAEPI